MSVQGDLFAQGWAARLNPAPSRRDTATERTFAHLSRLALTRPRLVKLLAALVLGNFLFAATLGPNGLARWSAISSQRAEHAAQLARLEGERERLANHVRLLDPARADVDLVDELVRRDLGFARPDEIVFTH